MRNCTAGRWVGLAAAIVLAGCATTDDGGAAGVGVTASSWEAKTHGGWADFPPERTLDGDLRPESSWRAEGDGAWIRYDLRAVTRVAAIRVAFVGADKRRYTFDVQVSRTGQDGDWRTVLDRAQSVEGSLRQETYAFAPCKVRYVRLVGHGNTHPQFGGWINVIEVEIPAGTPALVTPR